VRKAIVKTLRLTRPLCGTSRSTTGTSRMPMTAVRLFEGTEAETGLAWKCPSNRNLLKRQPDSGRIRNIMVSAIV
jgi:hypothetical protein